jgi:hypothetical protein
VGNSSVNTIPRQRLSAHQQNNYSTKYKKIKLEAVMFKAVQVSRLPLWRELLVSNRT